MSLKKLLILVINLLLIPALSFWLFSVIAYLVIYHEPNLFPSFSILLLRNKSGLILAITLIIFLYLCEVMNFFSPEGNETNKYWGRLRTKDEKRRHSKMMKENEIIKELNLECITYQKNGKPYDPHPIGGVLVASHTDRMYVLHDAIHSIYVGTTKSGKTESLLMPQLQNILDSSENAMIIDPKGTLYSEYGWKFRKQGYKVYRLNFIDPALGNFRNPFESGTKSYKDNYLLYKEKYALWLQKRSSALKNGMRIEKFLEENPEPVLNNSKAIEYWTDVAALLTFDKNAGHNASWNDHAKDMIVGGACLLAELGQFDYINITSIRMLFADPPQLQYFMKNFVSPKSDSFSLLSSFINSPDVTRDSMISVFNGKTTLLSLNKEIRMMTSYTDIDFTDLANEKCVLFFNCHDEKSTYFPLMSLFVDQIYQELVAVSRERLRTQGTEKLPRTVNFIFEEFGIMHPLKSIKTMIGACRSRGIRLYFFIQDFLQLQESYGKELAADIVAQCQHLVYLLSGDEQTKRDISSKAGTRQVWNRDKKMYEDIPVISVDELNALRMGEFVSIFQRIKGCCKHQFAYFKNARYYTEKPREEYELESHRKELKEVPVFEISEYMRKELNINVDIRKTNSRNVRKI